MAVYFVVAGWAVFDQAGRSLWGFGWWSLVALVTAGGAIATSWKRSYSARHRMSVSLMVTVALFGDAVIHTNHVVLNEIPFTSGVLAAVVGRLVLALVAIPLWAQEPLEYRRGALLWGDDSRGGDA